MTVGRPGRRFFATALLLVSTLSSPLVAQVAPPAVSSELAEAKRLTAAGQFDDARAIYERVAEQSPAEGLVALARFLNLTQDTTRLDTLIAQVQASDSGAAPLLRARVLVAGGRGGDARALLAAIPAAQRAPEATLLLATLLRDAGDLEGRERVLAEALAAPGERADRRLLLEALVSPHQHALGVDAELLLQALAAGIDSETFTLERAAKHVDGYLISQLERPDFPSFKATWLDQAPRLGGSAVWVAARLLVREERLREAAQLIEDNMAAARSSSTWALVAEQFATLLVSTGRVDEAPEWFAEAAKAGSFVATMEAARLAISRGDIAKAKALLDGVDVAALSYVQRGDLYSVRLDVEAATRNFEALGDVYITATANAGAEEFDHFHKVIFTRVIETADHNEIERRMRARFASDPATPPQLWRLVAEAANQGRRTPNAIEALYNCVLARPDDVPALEALAQTIKPTVVTLQQAPKDKLLAPQGEIERLATIARTALEALVRAQPFTPEHYKELLALYEALGVEDPAQAAIAVAARDSTQPRVKAAAAYALAIHGHPEAALPLYDEALVLAPDNMDIKMNRASCLTRLDRWEDAAVFYRSVLLEGFNGRPYHVHELVSRLWAIDQQLKREDAGIEWLRANVDKAPWRDEMLRDMGNLMANMGRPVESEEFYARLLQTGTNRLMRNEGHEGLARLLFRQQRFDDAGRVLLDAANANRDDLAVRRSFILLRAEILGRTGKLGDALAEVRALAAEQPDKAHDILFDAGEIAEGLDQPAIAQQLFREFLSQPQGGAAKRRLAEERLKAGANVP